MSENSRALQAVSLSLPLGSLDTYIYQANQIPLLTAQEETDLATRLKENNDLEAARQLVMSHLRYVIRVARGYMGYGLPLGDLIQEGNIGLMKAVKRFDPSVGVRLVSFAVHWIKAEIHEFVLKNWRIVKIATTKAQRKLFFNLRHMKKRLGWANREEAQDIANDLGVTLEQFHQMEQRLNAMDMAYNEPSDADDHESYHFAPERYLEDKNADPAQLIERRDATSQNNAGLVTAMAHLDDRAKDILTSRWLSDKKATLHELAAKYDVSAERIRQLERNAMDKIKKYLTVS